LAERVTCEGWMMLTFDQAAGNASVSHGSVVGIGCHVLGREKRQSVLGVFGRDDDGTG
jgi:hypothetical protein